MNKDWWKSKSVWTAIVMGILGVASAIEYTVPTWVFEILAGFGLYSIRAAIK